MTAREASWAAVWALVEVILRRIPAERRPQPGVVTAGRGLTRPDSEATALPPLNPPEKPWRPGNS